MRAHHSILLTLMLAGCASSPEASPSSTTSAQVATAAGFVDVPAQAHGANYPARMFYSLMPAETDRADRPLFVFFNGGPGGATSGGLLPWGTAPLRLSIDSEGLSPNPARFTQLGDALYIDQRQTGF